MPAYYLGLRRRKRAARILTVILITRLVVAAVLLQLSGCAGFLLALALPTPHSFRQHPEISGIVSKNDMPEGGKKVRVAVAAKDVTCSNFTSESTSDSEGRFKFPQKTKIEWVHGIQPWREWALCIEEEGQFVVAFSVRHYAFLHFRAPRYSVIASCQLSSVSLTKQPHACFAPRAASISRLNDAAQNALNAALVPSTCACQTAAIEQTDTADDARSPLEERSNGRFMTMER